jgi:hypothetical protein
LSYEADIEQNPLAAYSKVCSFLHLPEERVTVTRTRTNPYPMREMVENWSDIVKVLSGTPYEWMLEDPWEGYSDH